MCNSLAEGGLRCPSHVNKDIDMLKKSNHENLLASAKEAGVPLDQQWVEDRVTRFSEDYMREADSHGTRVEEAKEELLALHQETMDAKNALNDPSIRDSDDFVSPLHDLANVTDSIKEKFGQDSVKKEREDALAALTELPEFQSFEHMDEFVDTVNLYKMEANRREQLRRNLKAEMTQLDEKRLDNLHRDNPELARLRKKSAIANFFRPSADSSYDKEKAYEKALKEEQMRVGFQRSSTADFPAITKEIADSEKYSDEVLHRQRALNGKYEEHVRNRFYKENKPVTYRNPYEVETLIKKAPPSGTYRQLVYKDKLRSFNKKKDAYTALASKEYNADKEISAFRAEAASNAPLDPEKLKEFKTEVYNKTPEAKAINAELRQKRVQLSMTAAYRNDLEKQASRTSNPETALQLREKKRKLDALAEETMGKNRLKAMAESGKVPQGVKDGIKAYKMSAPAHYRANLAN